ncbi:hypothetical protein [Chamaesiphon sp. VAR_48_metabat_403]|uniref:hypothetical protein n=1 Tax=Chamaesiphon sp. VAR_48_metabat_403 TaxID=2964700 RepID=UPI00286E87A4|nr:hypothetical protein [Chamaesiphon sp. VAR_48_metabat_403]
MFFKKFFGRKNDGFFVQLEDEDASSKPAAKAQPEAKAKPAAAPAPAATVTKEATPVAAAATSAAPAAVAAKVDKKAAKKAEIPKVEAAPVPVVTAPPAPPITNFATDYLIKPSSSSSRRLPGANMRGFLELARQVDKPKAFKNTAAERKPGK